MEVLILCTHQAGRKTGGGDGVNFNIAITGHDYKTGPYPAHKFEGVPM